jgi:hypothetical protein
MDDERASHADADEPRRPGAPGDDGGGDAGETGGAEDGSSPAAGGREVVVPMRLYKTVTVFSTLVAVVCILGGFVLLDRGTQRATAAPEEVSLPVVVFGLALIVGGSAVYAFSTRFRTEGMGKPKDDTDEEPNNG